VSWRRVRGHNAQIAAFDRAFRRGRLAHAYLFTGLPGIGKRLFADELARALLCEAPARERLEACDQCPSCLQAAAGAHPDLFLVTRPEESHVLPIDVIRELSRSLGLKSARGRGKVAANCFLKTLEEPPPRSVLLLVGTSADRQLPTILSRCQVINFRPPPLAEVVELLRSQEIEDPAWAERVARLASGSPGQALALADKALWEFRRVLLDGLSRVPCDTIALSQAWMHFIEEAGKDSAAQRRRASLVLRLLIEFLKSVLAERLGGAADLVEPEDRRVLESLSSRLEPEAVLALLDRCLEADAQIDRRVQLVLIIEALVDALAGQVVHAKDVNA
jgi:DNA polymerase-3 subunit delta'